MTAQKGSLMLIKIGNGAETETFATLGGLRLSEMSLNQSVVDASCLGSGQWRQLQEGAGLKSVSLQGDGVFMDSAAEEQLRAIVFASEARHFRLYFGTGHYIQGYFVVRDYVRSGTHDAEMVYAIRLESAGDIEYVAS